MTSSLAKVNKSSGAHFLALFLKFPNFLTFLNIQIDLLILKTYYGQFTLTTKKLLHIIFKRAVGQPSAAVIVEFEDAGLLRVGEIDAPVDAVQCEPLR